MSILDRLGKDRSKINRYSSFRLTQEGREKVQEFGGDPKCRVLIALETRGTANLEEIATSSGVSKGQVERILPALVRGGFIQNVSATASSEE